MALFNINGAMIEIKERESMESIGNETKMSEGQYQAGIIFNPRPIQESQKVALEQIRSAFEQVGARTLDLLPAGRYKSLVTTKLEEAAMFATKAFSHTATTELK